MNMYTDSKSLYREGDIEDFYIIEEDNIIGEGGFSVVRKAIKRETGEIFAIKILDKYNIIINLDLQ
jgi:hypothetical protein